MDAISQITGLQKTITGGIGAAISGIAGLDLEQEQVKQFKKAAIDEQKAKLARAVSQEKSRNQKENTVKVKSRLEIIKNKSFTRTDQVRKGGKK